jgi:undecaprenyl-diphosphatase
MALIVASIPTGLIGFLLKDRVEEAFSSLSAVGAALIGTAVLLVLGDLAARRRVGAVREPPLPQDPGIWQSLVIGFMQGLAVMPGLSRSGSTISAGLIVGLEGVAAARFSFLLSIPAVAGATAITLLKHLDEIQAAAAGEIAGYLLGPLAAAAVGYAGIGLMMRVMKKARLGYFAIYCALLGIATLLVARG